MQRRRTCQQCVFRANEFTTDGLERDRKRPDVQASVLCKELWTWEDRGSGPLPPGAGMPEAKGGWRRGIDRSTGKDPIHSGTEKEPGIHRTASGYLAERVDSQKDTGNP